jgi:hypothetical protein
MNSLDDHGQCYKHRICNAAFPCDVCEGWSLEKRSQIDRMIEKSVKRTRQRQRALLLVLLRRRYRRIWLSTICRVPLRGT